MRNAANAAAGFGKPLSLLKIPAATAPFALRAPLTVTVRSAAPAAPSSESCSAAAIASFRIIAPSPLARYLHFPASLVPSGTVGRHPMVLYGTDASDLCAGTKK